MAHGTRHWFKGHYILLEDFPDYTAWHRSGRNPNVANGGTEDIWDYGGTYVFDTAGTAMALSSSSANDNQHFLVHGLNSGWNHFDALVHASGQTKVAIDGKFIRVFRVQNLGTTDNAGSVYVYDASSAVTNGVPDTATKIRAMMTIGANQTKSSLYTVPAGHRTFIQSWFMSLNALGTAATAAEATVNLLVRNHTGVFRAIKVFGLQTQGTSSYNAEFAVPCPDEQGLEEKTDVIARATTNGKALDITVGFTVEEVAPA